MSEWSIPGRPPDPPLHVFVHGGYWQELSEAESSFAALDMVPRGAAFAAHGPAPRQRDAAILQINSAGRQRRRRCGVPRIRHRRRYEQGGGRVPHQASGGGSGA